MIRPEARPTCDGRFLIRLAPGPGRDLGDVQRDINAHLDAGITLARRYLADGQPGRAYYELTRSLERQARVAGLGAIPITTAPCPCGGGATCPKDYRHQVPFLHPEATQ